MTKTIKTERAERVVMKWLGDYCGARPIIDIWRTSLAGEKPGGIVMAERLLVVDCRGLWNQHMIQTKYKIGRIETSVSGRDVSCGRGGPPRFGLRNRNPGIELCRHSDSDGSSISTRTRPACGRPSIPPVHHVASQRPLDRGQGQSQEDAELEQQDPDRYRCKDISSTTRRNEVCAQFKQSVHAKLSASF